MHLKEEGKASFRKESAFTRHRNEVMGYLSGKRCHTYMSSEEDVKAEMVRDAFRKKMNEMSQRITEREDFCYNILSNAFRETFASGNGEILYRKATIHMEKAHQ